MKKSFATVETKIHELAKEDSDVTDSDEDEEASHFQSQETGFQMIQHEDGFDDEEDSEDECVCDEFDYEGTQLPELIQSKGSKLEEATMLQQVFEERNAKVLFKQSHSKKIEHDLKNVMLLDSQSTVDLFCNPNLVDETFKSDKKMMVSHKATVKGCKNDVWCSNEAMTNVIALSNLIKQCRVTCNSKDQMCVVHREEENKPNMEFKMHESGLHCFDPRDKAFVFLNTVSGNKEGFSQRQIKEAEVAKKPHAKLGCPSMKDCKWVIQSNRSKNAQ
jgi:hypothetical protein